jgi:hypothetical protein
MQIMKINTVCQLNSDTPNPIENENPEPEIRLNDFDTVARRRTGKVASLPKSERNLVNRLLEDGAPYDDIVASLAQRGYTLSARNISNWFQGGYQDWLLLQQRLATHQLHQETALEILSNSDIDLTAAGLQIVATQLCQVLLASEPHRVDPQSGLNNYLRAANALCRITRQLIQIQKFHDDYGYDSDTSVSDNRTKNEPLSVSPAAPTPVVPSAPHSEPQVHSLGASGSEALEPSSNVSPLASPPNEGEADVAPAPAPPLFEGRVTTSLPHPSDGREARSESYFPGSKSANVQVSVKTGPFPTTVSYGNSRQPQKSHGGSQ